MKIKILRGDRGKWYYNTDNIGKEFCVIEYWDSSTIRFRIGGGYWVDKDDCVITELPESFCVKRCGDTEKWKKYIKWLNKTYYRTFGGYTHTFYGVIDNRNGLTASNDESSFGTELHIDDMIKHIDFYSEPMVVESEEDTIIDLPKEEFDLTTDEGRLAYAKKNYPIGTEYIPLTNLDTNFCKSLCIEFEPRIANIYGYIKGNGDGLIYTNGKWAEIVKKEVKMETQKLTRHGLKEIHSVACGNWKAILEGYSIRNSFEDYIELTQGEVDNMFNACTKEQLPIVSKYLKQNDGTFDLKGIRISENDFIEVRDNFEYKNKSFYLNDDFNWEIKKDSNDILCLIPTKKK